MIKFSSFIIVLSQNVGKHAGNLFISRKSRQRLADGWTDFCYGRTAVSDISLHQNGEYRSFILFFFTILYHLLDCKMVPD